MVELTKPDFTDEDYFELSELFSCVVDYATGGKLSKTNYTKETYYQAISEYMDDRIEKAVNIAFEITRPAEQVTGNEPV